jgi:pimeloyl-ACP methyl ester carboxylesterase
MKPADLALAGAAVLSVIIGPAAPATAQPAPGMLETVDSVFVSLAGDTVAAEYGFLWVPENRSVDNDRMIRLGFVRFPSTSDDPGPPIVYLAGGPGGSGIDAARGSRFAFFMALREAGDVIALAQRGTRGSIPYLTCPEPWAYPLEQALTREAFLQTMLDWSRLCSDYWRGLGIDLTAYNTSENADDVEDLRRALGAEQVSLLGISYGTHLALSVIRRHPAGVYRAVLAGVEGPDQTLKLPSSIQRILVRVDSLVRADTLAAARFPDFLGSVTAALDSLERSAVTVEGQQPSTGEPIPLTIGKFDVQWLTAGSIGNRLVLSQLPTIFERLVAGDYASIAQFVAGSRTRSMLAMTFAMDCASGASAARLDRISNEVEETLLGDAVDFPMPYICEAWPHVPPDEASWEPVRSGIPVQFISGTLDGRTPVSNADEVRGGFRNSGHLVLEGAGHSDDLLIGSRRISEIILSFLHGGPAIDEVTEVPFRIFVPE